MAKRSKKTSSPIQAVPEDGLYASIGIEDIEAGVAATSMAWTEVDYHEETWAPPPARPRPDDGTISPELRANLTPKPQLFVQEYLVDLNGKQAAIRAGYSEDSATEIGYENLRKPHVLQAIEYALMERTGITRSRLVDELGAVAFSNIKDVVSWTDEVTDLAPGDKYWINGEEHVAGEGGITRVIRQRVRIRPAEDLPDDVARMIAEVQQTDKGSIKIKLHDKNAALDKLARALGMYQEPAHVEDHSKTDMRATIIYEGRADRPARRPAPPKPVGGPRDIGD
jgi:phage terminase small subunit